jgi:adenylate cyclase class IV
MIVFDDIQDFGLGIEAEIISTKAEEEKALLEIETLFNELGVKKNQILPISTTITAIIMEQRSRF